MATMMVMAVAAPAAATEPADISVSAGNTSYTVTVTHNGTAVNDTEVRVTPTDPANATYAGDAGLTDENGTVTFGLPENETEVNISTTYNGTETTITYLLPAAGHEDEPSWDGEGPFGLWVSQLVHDLFGDESDVVGQVLAQLVTENNPGSEHRSDNANPGGDGNGPPDHAKNDAEDEDDEDEEDDGHNGKAKGRHK